MSVVDEHATRLGREAAEAHNRGDRFKTCPWDLMSTDIIERRHASHWWAAFRETADRSPRATIDRRK